MFTTYSSIVCIFNKEPSCCLLDSECTGAYESCINSRCVPARVKRMAQPGFRSYFRR